MMAFLTLSPSTTLDFFTSGSAIFFEKLIFIYPNLRLGFENDTKQARHTGECVSEKDHAVDTALLGWARPWLPSEPMSRCPLIWQLSCVSSCAVCSVWWRCTVRTSELFMTFKEMHSHFSFLVCTYWVDLVATPVDIVWDTQAQLRLSTWCFNPRQRGPANVKRRELWIPVTPELSQVHHPWSMWERSDKTYDARYA